MKNNLSIEDLVGSYLDGDMTEAEILQFERKLEVDPAIREELALQKDIIQSVREARRAELKSRLSDIKPPSTPLVQTVGIKIAAIASITAIVGTGAYFMLTPDVEKITPIELSEKPSESAATEDRIPSVPEIQVPSEEMYTPEEGTVAEVEEPAKSESPEAEKKESEEVQAPPATPEVVRPDIAEITEEAEPETGEMVEEDRINNLSEMKEAMSGQLAVEVEKSRRFRFHYKFYNDKLYLLGDFKDSPYEIIELNTSSGKRYFLYFQGNYYRLSPDKVKPTPLQKLSDEAVIEELKIIQQNK